MATMHTSEFPESVFMVPSDIVPYRGLGTAFVSRGHAASWSQVDAHAVLVRVIQSNFGRGGIGSARRNERKQSARFHDVTL